MLHTRSLLGQEPTSTFIRGCGSLTQASVFTAHKKNPKCSFLLIAVDLLLCFQSKSSIHRTDPRCSALPSAAVKATVEPPPAASWTLLNPGLRRRPEACLFRRGDIWGRGSSCPTLHKLTWPHRQDQAPGGQEAHLQWNRRQSTSLPPKRHQPGGRGARLDPGGSLVRLSSGTGHLGSASHALEASAARQTIISKVKAHTVRAWSPRR